MEKRLKHPDYMTTRGERLSYWSYFIGQNLTYSLLVIILPTFLLMVGVDVTKIAAAIFIVKAWDAVNDVFFGIIFDKAKFKNGQKCMPWIRISVLLLPFASLLMYLMPGGLSENGKVLWFIVAYICWDTAYTLTDVPIFSLVTSMTNNLKERNNLLSIGRIFATGAQAVLFLACTVLVSEQVGVSFTIVAIFACIASLLFMIPIGVMGRERIVPETEEESYTVRSILKYLGKNKYLLYFYIGYTISSLFATTLAVDLFVSYYLFGSALFSTLINVISMGPMFLVALFIPKLLQRFDKFKLFRNCTVLAVVLGFVIYFVGYKNMTIYIILAALRAVPLAVVVILGLTFTPDCVEYGLYKTGIDARGLAFAVQSFAVKFASAAQSVGLFILGLFGWATIEAANFAELETLNITQSATALKGLWITYILVPTIGGLLSLIPYLLYKLNDKDVQVMAKCNSGEITKEEAERQLSRKY